MVASKRLLLMMACIMGLHTIVLPQDDGLFSKRNMSIVGALTGVVGAVGGIVIPIYQLRVAEAARREEREYQEKNYKLTYSTLVNEHNQNATNNINVLTTLSENAANKHGQYKRQLAAIDKEIETLKNTGREDSDSMQTAQEEKEYVERQMKVYKDQVAAYSSLTLQKIQENEIIGRQRDKHMAEREIAELQEKLTQEQNGKRKEEMSASLAEKQERLYRLYLV